MVVNKDYPTYSKPPGGHLKKSMQWISNSLAIETWVPFYWFCVENGNISFQKVSVLANLCGLSLTHLKRCLQKVSIFKKLSNFPFSPMIPVTCHFNYPFPPNHPVTSQPNSVELLQTEWEASTFDPWLAFVVCILQTLVRQIQKHFKSIQMDAHSIHNRRGSGCVKSKVWWVVFEFTSPASSHR